MQALILAAGYGKRLQPLTNKIPKSLVKVNDIPLLLNILECFSGRTIQEVLIVVGDKKEQIVNTVGYQYKEMNIIYIENPIYKHTNNVYSLWLARNYINDDLLMSECDIFYKRSLIDKILEKKDIACNILVSKYNPSIMDGTIVEADDKNKASALILKQCQTIGCDYTNMAKTVNVYYFQKKFIVDQFMPAIETYVKTQSVNSYYELVLGSLIYYRNNDIRITYIDDKEWCEIDDMDDLKRAHILFNSKNQDKK
jgi:choline kinase